jgi:hypothetical protein
LDSIPTFKWFNKSIENKIAPDQANLLGMFLRTFEKDLNESLGDSQSIKFKETIELLKSSARNLSEPNRQFIQELKFKQLELEQTLGSIEAEIEKVESVAERRILFYLYLLILLSIVQILVFYYCIFHVEWLGWDIMEPLTYTVEIIGVAIAMRFYLKYGVNRNFKGILDLHKTKFICSRPNMRFRYNKLKENFEEVSKELTYLEKSIKFYQSRNSVV